MTRGRWLQLTKGLRIAEHPEMFRRLHEAYSEGRRHYHTGAHIDACLRELEPYRRLARFPYEVELALWFHDVVYVPGAADNESRSAQVAINFLAAAGAPSRVANRVHDHIVATKHETEPRDLDSALVADVDLAILGQDAPTYARFEAQIREEYEWMPLPLFRRKRSEVLATFLERSSIYWLPQFRKRYDVPARANLEAAIAELAK